MNSNITLDTYHQAKDRFVKAMAPIQEKIRALYLFGSFARGEAVPGYSDLDFWIFFEADLFEDRAAFRHMLSTLDQSMTVMQNSGIPLYNFCGYTSVADIEQLPALLAANLSQPANSQLLLGEDIRTQMASTAVSRQATQASTFFEMRRQLYLPLLPLINQSTLSKKERGIILQALQFIKYVPEAMCAALDLWPGEANAAATLHEQYPHLDLQPVKTLKQFCIEQAPIAPDLLLQQTAQEAIRFMEQLNNTLLNRRHCE